MEMIGTSVTQDGLYFLGGMDSIQHVSVCDW